MRTISPFTLLALLMLPALFSCSRKNVPAGSLAAPVIYPAPPDTARIQFLTTISSSEQATGKQTGMSKFIFGEAEAKPIKKPYGIASAPGKIYICDAGLRGLEIIDLEKNTFSYFSPTGPGQLKLPINCSVDENRVLYVADADRKQVVVYDSAGNFLSAFGEKEDFKPTDVFVYGDEIWVTNVKNHRVSVFSRADYSLLRYFPRDTTDKTGYLYSPTNLYVTGDRVYVSDMGDFRVKSYTHDGTFLKAIGGTGITPGLFTRPKGIAVDQESNLFVIDAGFENAQIFNREGKLLLFFGGPYKGPGDMWLPAKVAVDYENNDYFSRYLYKDYRLKYLIYVTNQYGPDKINVYGAIEPK